MAEPRLNAGVLSPELLLSPQLSIALANNSRNNDSDDYNNGFRSVSTCYMTALFQHFALTTELNSIPTTTPEGRCYFPPYRQGI